MSRISFETEYRLPRATAFGDLLSPLDKRIREHQFCAKVPGDALRSKLRDYSDKGSDSEHRNFMADIYPDLHHFFIDSPPDNLGKLSLHQGDVLYLMSDPVGNILRRPFVAAYLAATARLQVPCSPAAEAARDILLDCVGKMGFSKFYGSGSAKLKAEIDSRYPEQSASFDPAQVIDTFKNHAQANPNVVGPYVYDLDVWAQSHTRQLIALEGGVFNQLYRATREAANNGAELGTFPFFADAGHVFNAWETVRLFRYHVDKTLEPLIAAKTLPCDVSVMVVEDNRFFAWAIQEFRHCPQMRPFVSSKEWIDQRAAQASGFQGASDKIDLLNGWFKNAEEALECLLDGIQNGKIPDVMFIDIELGCGMNGLEFAQRAHEMCREAGKHVRIMFVTSSNLGFYREALEELQRQGIVKSSRTKAAFYLPDVLDELAVMLAQPNIAPL